MNFAPGASPDQALIQSIINAELIFQRRLSSAEAQPPVIALARDYGSGGDVIARRLAERLQVDIFDRQILEHISKDTFISTGKLSELEDKSSADKVISWLHDLFSVNTTYPSYYRHHLVNVILRICQQGGIILGRGAHVILTAHPAFRVRIVGSLDYCIDRVAMDEQLDERSAQEKIEKINAERVNYLRNLFGRQMHEAHFFDLVINTDNFSNLDGVADIILMAMKETGLNVNSAPGSLSR